MGDGAQLGAVPRGVIVQFEERDGEEFHVFGDGEDLCYIHIKARFRIPEGRGGEECVLRSGICTRKSFLHSFGLVICAGTKGYYRNVVESGQSSEQGGVREPTQRNAKAIHGPSHKSRFTRHKRSTYHERLEVRPPPLR